MAEQFTIKVALTQLEPQIWRKFTVPSDTPLDHLHLILQAVMGWENAHLHQFTAGGEIYTVEMARLGVDDHNEADYSVGDLLKETGDKLTYIYDMGDSWEHSIELVEKKPAAGKEKTPAVACLDGEFACPPEDIGGFIGYPEFVEAISDKDHPEHEEMAEWYFGDPDSDEEFDPFRFDVDEVNRRLKAMVR
ncbi:MAG: hypothetical protein MAG453_01593 [Calditrichaeota bacterium]|nr:hypothetical protein [Calditrichota bacterium]